MPTREGGVRAAALAGCKSWPDKRLLHVALADQSARLVWRLPALRALFLPGGTFSPAPRHLLGYLVPCSGERWRASRAAWQPFFSRPSMQVRHWPQCGSCQACLHRCASRPYIMSDEQRLLRRVHLACLPCIAQARVGALPSRQPGEPSSGPPCDAPPGAGAQRAHGAVGGAAARPAGRGRRLGC